MNFDAVIFDLDGVVTKTALVHARAWKMAFDEYLRMREKRDGEQFREFTHDGDYLPFVDGKPRYEGVKSFLESRKIDIPFGDPSDTLDKETVCGIGNRKNSMFNKALKEQGAEIYESTIKLIKDLKAANIHVGVASSSKNCGAILQSANLADLFETNVDGLVSVELKLKGKPEGDIFVQAARNVGAVPARSVVVEDATSGVQAGRNGGFGLVLGVAREGNEAELLKNGADIVVKDLSEIDIEKIEKWFHKKPLPLLQVSDTSAGLSIFSKKKLVFFLDYDGTLTPIVERPELAIMAEDMRDVVTRLSKKHTVAIVSGRMREDVENLVKIKGLFYVGSHGFDIKGPKFSMIEPRVREVIPLISQVISELKKEIGPIPGALIEEKKFSVAVHYRLVDEKKYLPRIKEVVDNIVKRNPALRVMSGKKVFEIMPDIDWDKGKAIRWIVETIKISWDEDSVIYIGDDVTDEYAFRAVRTRGTGILVSDPLRESAADFHLSSPDEVKKLFKKIIAREP